MIMYNAELKQIEKDIHEFYLINKDRYKILIELQEKLLYLEDEKTYQDILEFIDFNKSFFFKDHQNSVLFFQLVVSFSSQYFKKMEIFLDIIVYFSKELKKNISDSEIIMNHIDYVTLFYLFSKNYFTINSILLSFYSTKLSFIKFFPEIDIYNIPIGWLSPLSSEDYSISDEIKSNPEKYILYRNMCYHPSILHKSIRDDDIDAFQSILALNNYDVNYQIEHSYYDRTPRIGQELPTLIEIAAVYGSINIFKFLWMQPHIEIGFYLLDYAFLGQNLDIIHICESKGEILFPFCRPILMHHFPFLIYCFEKFDSWLFEFNPVAEKFFNCFRYYSKIKENINYYYLNALMVSYDYSWILNLLILIAFIVKNLEAVEFPNQLIYDGISLLSGSIFDVELFKFLYKQRKSDLEIHQCDLYYSIMRKCVLYGNYEVFKIIYDDLYDSVESFELFLFCLGRNNEIANYLLDIQFKNNFVFHQFQKKITFLNIHDALEFYDEDIIVKMIQLYLIKEKKFCVTAFCMKLKFCLSEPMILSLMKRLLKIFDNHDLYIFADFFYDYRMFNISKFILKNMKITKKAKIYFLIWFVILILMVIYLLLFWK